MTDPEQVSGISAAAIEGASEASDAGEMPNENAEKMTRPGPGLDVGRDMNRHRGSPPSDVSSAPESGTVRDIEREESHEEESPDDFDRDFDRRMGGIEGRH